MKRAAVLSAALTLGAASPAGAQTVASVASRGVCSTSGIEGLSSQLVATQICMRPTLFVRAAPHAGVNLTSSRIHPLMTASARDALWRAARSRSLSVNSMFRTLADQYVLYYSRARAASPRQELQPPVGPRGGPRQLVVSGERDALGGLRTRT
ncbi:MAG: hypothetical protein R3A52_30425 [Polyangiales bacterium]